MTFLSHLACSRTGAKLPAGRPYNLSEAGAPLLARYDLVRARTELARETASASQARSMWRYGPLLPVSQPANIVSLGEGMTPLLAADRLASELGINKLWIKDESRNSTGTYKARCAAAAVSMAKELGLRKLAAASTGDGASALAACCAAAGIEAHVFLPDDAPEAGYIECCAFGARVTLVEGLVNDCERLAGHVAEAEGWFDASAFKEPYGLEGAKTIGYEIAEQLGWRLPGALICPAGEGAALTAVWKAFDELEQLGWIGGERPRMAAVQAAGCAPIVRAFEQGQDAPQPWPEAWTAAAGLRVPEPRGGSLVLAAVRASGGTCLAVPDGKMLDAAERMAQAEGLFPAPEGAACAAALQELAAQGFLRPGDETVLLNAGSGLKRLEAWQARVPPAPRPGERLGGLILPR